ncbi:MAG: aspartate aminotransferase family protein [Bryobacterales bacterium]|nr:aspartate aminotransferase family protein [Bryobacteraceae bacterium]MDW8354525.1 aspartate aminotransferase family protein [Bryobacterales bacterium]
MSDKWAKSREWLERARRSLPLGVSSPFRAKFPVPLYFAGGRGPYLTDVDGNRYIDYTLGWGPNILGYGHPAVVEALQRQAAGPHTYGAQHELEFLVAEKIRELVPCAERVIFSSSGSEAVQLALRLARAFTGRHRVLKFEGHYHGWMDSVLISHHPPAEAVGAEEAPVAVLESRGQTPNAAENVLVAVWNRVEAVEAAFARARGEIAAVIMEPVLCNSGCLMPRPGYLEAVREICRREGALLIFDEIITGFRMAVGGAQQYYGVTPDLATFGKALGGGLPVSAVAGCSAVMDLIGHEVAFGGSFNGNPIVLAAARATLEELSRNDGAALAHANRMGQALMDGIREAARRRSVPLVVSGFGAAFAVHFTDKADLYHYRDTLADDRERLRRFALALLERGVYMLPDGRFYVSAVHGAEQVHGTVEAVDAALGTMS